jgi:VWFA-related protein
MRRGPAFVWLPVIAITLCACAMDLSAQPGTAPAGQTAPNDSKAPFVFKTSSQLVLVDVVASNGKGDPVTDLTAQDFTITEDGRPQTLNSFSFHPAESAGSDAQVALPPPPPGVVTNIPRYKNAGSWNVIVLDSLNSPLLDQSNTREQLLQVITKIPDQPVAIYVLGAELLLVQDFSSDPRVLKQVIAGLKNEPSALLDNPKGGHEGERYTPELYKLLPASAKAAILRWEGEGTAAHTRDRLRTTLAALNFIARNLKPLPGRKNLIWVSEGFPFSIEPGATVNARESVSGRDYKVEVAATANALFDSQVAIYPIDSRGVLTSSVFDAASRGYDAIGRRQTTIGLTSTISEENNNLDVTHTSMQEIAERTGGRAFYNRNEIGNALLESLNDGATYYTLAYSPVNKDWNGRFRHIKIRTERNGVKLRYRLGYFAMPANTGSPSEQAIAFNRAMDINSPASTGVLFQAKVLPPSPENQLVVNYAISPASLSFQKGPDDLQHLSVNCAVEAYSTKGESVRKEGTTYAAALKADIYDRVVREGFPCQQKLTLPPGDYILRLGVRDNVTGQIGTTDARITVPALPPAKNLK